MPHADPDERKRYAKRWRESHREYARDYNKTWGRKNPEKVRGYRKKINARIREATRYDVPLRQRRLVYSAKDRARKHRLPFSITVENIFWPKVCPVLGIPLNYCTTKRWAADSATLDRTVPSLGYVPRNVVVMSWRANCLKRDATPAEIYKLADYMRRKGD